MLLLGQEIYHGSFLALGGHFFGNEDDGSSGLRIRDVALNNPSRSSRRDGSFQIEERIVSRPGDFEEFRNLGTRSSCKELKGSQLMGERFSDANLIEERTGEIWSWKVRT